MRSLAELLHAARERQLFSGAAWSVGTADGPLMQGRLGTLSWGGPPVQENTPWDLASVTKPIVGLAVMSLVESGELLLDDTVGAHLARYAATDKAQLTVRELLTHTSGLPGQVELFRSCETTGQMLVALAKLPLMGPPGGQVIYSSQGFMLLGLIAECAAGTSLDALTAQRVLEPAGMVHTSFGLKPECRSSAAATEDCPWRGRVVQGTVHDENAVILSRPSGHAGVFSTIRDVALLGMSLCAGGQGSHGQLLSEPSLSAMVRPATDPLLLRRSLGWQGVDRLNCPAGDLIAPASYGHTGFTGTSLWIDVQLGCYVALLTNRVHPTRSAQGFDNIRRAFHNMALALVASGTDVTLNRPEHFP